MTEIYTPAVRVVVVASLLLAIATMTFVTARVAGAANACSAVAACESDPCGLITSAKRYCAAFAVDFTVPATRVAWAGLIAPTPRNVRG
ncbi:MAG TPA: hypothetical protein VNR39_21845 [Pseudolabrys sp.]|nr:hypothetical protein [Pseudolabrys sp.]